MSAVELNIPTYNDIIKRPMDYSTLRRRINQGIYNNLRPRALYVSCFLLSMQFFMLQFLFANALTSRVSTLSHGVSCYIH